MKKATLYLDADCKNCEEYIEALELFSGINQYELEVVSIDDDHPMVFKRLRALRLDGHDINFFPFLVIEIGDNIVSVHDKILTPLEVQGIII